MAKSFRQELLETVDAIKEARKDSKLTVSEVIKITGEVAQVVERICVSIGPDDTEFNQLVLDVEWLVETYVVPYDIPFIGPFVERSFVDPQLVNAVRPALEAMRPKA